MATTLKILGSALIVAVVLSILTHVVGVVVTIGAGNVPPDVLAGAAEKVSRLGFFWISVIHMLSLALGGLLITLGNEGERRNQLLRAARRRPFAMPVNVPTLEDWRQAEARRPPVGHPPANVSARVRHVELEAPEIERDENPASIEYRRVGRVPPRPQHHGSRGLRAG